MAVVIAVEVVAPAAVAVVAPAAVAVLHRLFLFYLCSSRQNEVDEPVCVDAG